MLNGFAKSVVYDLLRLVPAANLSIAIEGLINNCIRMYPFLAATIFLIFFIRLFLPREKTTRTLVNQILFILFGPHAHHFCGCRIPVQRLAGLLLAARVAVRGTVLAPSQTAVRGRASCETRLA
jgi:hypothetical protein